MAISENSQSDNAIGIPYEDIELLKPQPEAIEMVPREFAVHNQILPLAVLQNSLKVAIASIDRLQAIDDLSVLINKQIDVVLADPGHIRDKLEARFLEGMLGDMSGPEDISIDSENISDLADLQKLAGEAAVVQMVNVMFAQAVRDRVSDIHIEPYEKSLKIRFRTDGILTESMSPPKRMHAAITSRLKILAELNIAERRLPQDGRIKLTIGARQVDVRLSIVPTVHGERAVMRILDKGDGMLSLKQLGMREDTLSIFRKLINVPYGMILVTGPTGSGKSTTLYAALQEIYSPRLNILTIEDPVEYQVDGIGQIQVRANIGLSFANGLRSIVRQDPDVIMVGEIRDHETAEIAIHAALTGHLVFSTLHTNDAPSAVTRLTDMGVEPFLAASSIIGILAQRLVRRNCPDCLEEYQPEADALIALGLQDHKGPFMRGKGCQRCGNTGYKGRRGVYELLTVDEEVRRMTVEREPASSIKNHAVNNQKMRTLLGDGRLNVIEGITTADEVLRVCQREDL